MIRVRKQTVEHPFRMLNQWMGTTHLLTRKPAGVDEFTTDLIDRKLKTRKALETGLTAE